MILSSTTLTSTLVGLGKWLFTAFYGQPKPKFGLSLFWSKYTDWVSIGTWNLDLDLNDDPMKVASLLPIVGVTASPVPGSSAAAKSRVSAWLLTPLITVSGLAFFARSGSLFKAAQIATLSRRVLDFWTRTFDTELKVSKANNNLESGQLSI